MTRGADKEDSGFILLEALMPEKYILLEDALAQKQTSAKWNPLAAKSFIGEHLLRGSLLVELTDSEARDTQQHFTPPLNYKKYSDDSVKLYCKPEQVLQLSDQEFNLLLGVKLSFDRYKVLNILHWVKKLKVGYGVNVTIPTIPNPVRGVIRYVGPLPSEEGTKFGIELMQRRGQGASDGTFKNTEYFKCDRDCAMFVAMDKLSEPESSKSSQVHEIAQPPPQAQDAPLKLGDIVTFYDENDKPINGLVRWIGRNTDVLRNGSRIVGIETDQHHLPGLIPGNLVRMNHMFTLHNSKDAQVFLPIDSVLKLDNDPPNAPAHPYNLRSKDKHNVDPAATLHLIHDYSKMEGRSQKEFMLEQRKHHEEIELKRQQEEAAKRQEKQSGVPGKDFDVQKVNVDVQKRLYEEAQRASKQGGEGQSQIESGMDTSSGGMDNSQQRHHQPQGNQQGSSVDPTDHGHLAGQREFYGAPGPQHQRQQPGYHQGSDVGSTGYGQQQHFQGSQAYQHQNQQPGYYQGPNVDHTGYGQNVGQQQFYDSQVPQRQSQQPGYYQGPNIDPAGYGQNVGQYGSQVPHHQNQQPGYNYQDVSHYPNQPPHPHPDPVAQMAHIPRAIEGGSHPHYNPATGMPHDHSGGKSQGPHRQVSHQYEPVPGPADLPDPHSQHHQQHPASNQTNPYNLEEGSMILYGDPPRPGIIKWLGYLPEVNVLSAGIEMDDYMKGTSDGVWKDNKYFISQPGRGIFVPLTHLRPDTRFGGGNTNNESKPPNPLEQYKYVHESRGAENVQCSTVLNKERHIGRPKGIQGHQNSCYLDATVYGMFAFTDVFDKLFLKTRAKSKHDDKVRWILLKMIVNPLRKKDVVIYDAVMNLRTALDELVDNVQGLTSDEKDPEEFLNLLFKHVLHVEPFLCIRRPSGTDREFFVQLFVEPDKSMPMPTTERLLMKMFKEQKITFAKIPTRLLLQVPRYGKQFKSFDKTIPSLELEINEICDEFENNLCRVCGEKTGLLLCRTENLSFCERCSRLWHNHPERADGEHNMEDISVKLKLISVICIETSHYVCFTRITGSGDDQWLFFDSMAERQDDLYNIPEVRLCTNELEKEVYKNQQLIETPLNKLSELARRFVRDAYLCIYADPQQIMYDEDDN